LQVVSAHGANIPVIGYGTWRLTGEECARGVAEALRVGYRHIDTAASYDNEDRVAEGIRAAGVPRDEIFITTKVRPGDLEEARFFASVERSLGKLEVDKVDLLLIHWPSKVLTVAETIATLNAVKSRGWTRHIGVSNFTVRLLAEAWAASEAPLVTNQCEFHPYLNQDKLRAAVADKGMIFTAYAPLGRGVVFDDPAIVEIASRHGLTPAQVVLRWDIQQGGMVTIPKSATPARIRENLDIFDFALADEEMAAISALSKTHRRRVANPAGITPDWDD
jgi:2,5-diketo-D-gluconate reductase B